MISFFAAWLLPDPVVPRMNPLPFMSFVRSMTTGLPVRAFAPWNTPPGSNSSWDVSGRHAAFTDVRACDLKRPHADRLGVLMHQERERQRLERRQRIQFDEPHIQHHREHHRRQRLDRHIMHVHRQLVEGGIPCLRRLGQQSGRDRAGANAADHVEHGYDEVLHM